MDDLRVDTTLPAVPTLGPKVRALRKNQRKTLAEVSKATGLSISALSKIENDQVSPTFANLMRLAEGLGVSLSDLVTLEGGEGECFGPNDRQPEVGHEIPLDAEI